MPARHSFDSSSEEGVDIKQDRLSSDGDFDYDDDDLDDLPGMDAQAHLPVSAASRKASSPSPKSEPAKPVFIDNHTAAPWTPPHPSAARAWTRAQEFEEITAGTVFASPLDTKPAYLWPGMFETPSMPTSEVLLLYRTSDGLLGKLLAALVAPTLIRVKWHTFNSIFPSAQLPPYSEGEVELKLIDEDTEDRPASFMDLTFGGLAWDLRTYYENARRPPDGVKYVLGPNLGFFLGRDRNGELRLPYVKPCRDSLIHIYQTNPFSSIDVNSLLLQGIEDRFNDEAPRDNMCGYIYKTLYRRITDITHFKEEQVEDLFKQFTSVCETAEDDLNAGTEVLLDYDSLMALIDAFAPANEPISSAFLKSDTIREGIWWLVSDPVRSGYDTMSPASKRLNRVVRFARLLDVLNTTLFGGKIHVVEFCVQMLAPGDKRYITRDEFLRALKDIFGEEDEELLEEFPFITVSGTQLVTIPMLRKALWGLDLFNMWSGFVAPLLKEKKWGRENTALV